MLAPIGSILRRADALRRRIALQHTGKPDISQRLAYLLVIKFLETFAPEKLLNPRMIDDHPQKTSRRQQRIDIAKLSFVDPLTDVVGEDLVIFRDVGAKKALGKTVVLEATEQ